MHTASYIVWVIIERTDLIWDTHSTKCSWYGWACFHCRTPWQIHCLYLPIFNSTASMGPLKIILWWSWHQQNKSEALLTKIYWLLLWYRWIVTCIIFNGMQWLIPCPNLNGGWTKSPLKLWHGWVIIPDCFKWVLLLIIALFRHTNSWFDIKMHCSTQDAWFDTKMHGSTQRCIVRHKMHG